jgi:predicted RNA-binding Zn ribbon-like protein
LAGGDALGLRWQAEPAEADPLLRRSLDLRETIYRVFAEEAPSDPDVATLNAALREAPVRHTLARTPAGFAWRADAWSPTLPCLLAPVLWSAADLLAGPGRAVVRCCANPRCRVLFLDESRTGNRRWCSMAGCGNREKARRHYQRTRTRAAA